MTEIAGTADHSDRCLRRNRPRAGAGARLPRRTPGARGARPGAPRDAGAGMSGAWRRSARLPTDVTNQQDCEWLVAETVKAFGGIDVVVHNAGITMWSRFDALQDLSIFERIMEVNYLAPGAADGAVAAASQAIEGAAGGGGEPRGTHRRAGAFRVCGQQTCVDRVLRFVAHRIARQWRRRERDRAGFRGQRDSQARDRARRRAARRLANDADRRS